MKKKFGMYDLNDFMHLGIIAIVLAIVALRYINHDALPYEDAAMIFRYAEHIAGAHGFVWNIGEAPVDGATDVLFTLLVAAFVKLSIPVETAVHSIIATSHLIVVWITYHTVRYIIKAPYLMAALSAGFIAVGSPIRYYETYFATSFFALLTTIVWYYVQKIVYANDSSFSTSLRFSVACLLLGLARPEGVFLSFFILLSVVYLNGFSASRKIVQIYFLIYLLAGGAYFLWHWNYFGSPLPNPFYKKWGGGLHPESLRISFQNIFRMMLPLTLHFFGLMLLWFIQLVGTFLRRHNAELIVISREALYPMIPITLFMGIWILLSNEMNFVGRYQYAVIPIASISWYSSMRALFRDNDIRIEIPEFLNSKYIIVLVSFVLIVSLSGMRLELLRGATAENDGRLDIALKLKEFRSKNYTLAVSEAGLLPYYSGWKTIDTWGLNDIWIAHNKQITEEYLARYKPDIIMFYGPYPADRYPDSTGAFMKMVRTVHQYATTNHYFFVAAFGTSPYGVHHYFVKRDNSDAEELCRIIRETKYIWWQDGRESINFAAENFPASK